MEFLWFLFNIFNAFLCFIKNFKLVDIKSDVTDIKLCNLVIVIYNIVTGISEL